MRRLQEGLLTGYDDPNIHAMPRTHGQIMTIPVPKLLAEILRIQRWAGGESVRSARIYGLMHGFESVLKEETEYFGISREVQDKVEDILQDVEDGSQAADGLSIKQRLLEDDIDEIVAGRVVQLCRLQSRFPEATDKLTSSRSHFSHLRISQFPEQEWLGALHWMELVDCTEGAYKKLHGCISPTVPRVGEVITPESGSAMRVVDVEYKLGRHGLDESATHNVLTPYVYLECEESDDAGG